MKPLILALVYLAFVSPSVGAIGRPTSPFTSSERDVPERSLEGWEYFVGSHSYEEIKEVHDSLQFRCSTTQIKNKNGKGSYPCFELFKLEMFWHEKGFSEK
jgi:hypothetical protein